MFLIPVELRGQLETFQGFFIQARTENNQETKASIVGTWTPLNTTLSKTIKCNVKGVSYHIYVLPWW